MFLGTSEMLIFIFYMFGLGAGLPMGTPPAPEDPMMAKIAPDECLFYATWTGVAEIDPDANPTEAWWGQPEIQKMITKLIKAHRGQVIKQAKDSDDPLTLAFADLLLHLSEISMEHPVAFYLEDFKIDDDQPNLKGAALIGLGDETDDIEKLVETLDRRLQERKGHTGITKLMIDEQPFYQIETPGNKQTITFGLRGKYFVFGFGEGALKRLAANSKTAPPKWLDQIRTELPVQRFSSLSYLNAKRLFPVLKSGFSDDFFYQEPERFARSLDRLIGHDLQDIAWVSGLDDKGYLCRTSIRTSKELTGVLKVIDGEPITQEMIEKIPADPMISVATRFSTTRTLELLSKFAEDVGEKDDWDKQLQQFQEITGMRLKEELLETLDDYVYFYFTPDMQNPMKGWIASIRIEDEMSFPDTFEAVNNAIKSLIEESDSPFEFQKEEIEGFDFYSIDSDDNWFGRMSIAWVLDDKELVLGPNPQAILKHLEGPPAANQMLETEAVKQFLQHGKQEGFRGPVAMTSFNVPRFLELIWSFIQMFGGGDEPIAPDFDFSFNDIPGLDVLTKQVAPNRFAIYRTERGFEVLQRQTYPSSTPGATAVAIGLLAMPHVADDIVNVGQTGTANDLKQLMLSMHVYESAHQKFPASHTENKAGKRLLSWRVHLLPLLDEKELYDQFHLDEPWDSPHNKKLIEKMPDVFKHPTLDLPPGQTVYLAVTGEDGALAGPRKRSDTGRSTEGKHGFGDITDGTSNTIVVIAVNRESAVPWTKPADLSTDVKEVRQKTTQEGHPGRIIAGFADGSVHPIKVSDEVLSNLLHIADGETVELPD